MKELKLFKPFISKEAIKEVTKVLKSDYLAEGPKVKEFTKAFEKKFNKKNVVMVNSGTSALELAYEILDIKEGDYVISPVLTCVATNIPLARRKANIIFTDTQFWYLNLNYNDVSNILAVARQLASQKITKFIKAIVFVHFGGNNIGLEEILELGKKYNVPVIEDACQAIGSDYWGHADFTAVSFQAIKTLTTGEGGALICKRKEDYELAKKLKWYGIDREEKRKVGQDKFFDFENRGFKFNMCDIQAAIGLGNLKVIDKIIAHRKKLMKLYEEAGFIPGIWFSVGFSNIRKELIKYCKSKGIEIGMHHFRNDLYKAFKGKREFLPVMNSIEDKYYILPQHHGISIQDAKYIIRTIKEFEK